MEMSNQMPIRWDFSNTKLGRKNIFGKKTRLWKRYQADNRIQYSIPEQVALWVFGKSKRDYSQRTIPALGEPIFTFTKELAVQFLKEAKFVFLDEKETEEMKQTYKPYVQGLIGMQVWADLFKD